MAKDGTNGRNGKAQKGLALGCPISAVGASPATFHWPLQRHRKPNLSPKQDRRLAISSCSLSHLVLEPSPWISQLVCACDSCSFLSPRKICSAKETCRHSLAAKTSSLQTAHQADQDSTLESRKSLVCPGHPFQSGCSARLGPDPYTQGLDFGCVCSGQCVLHHLGVIYMDQYQRQ